MIRWTPYVSSAEQPEGLLAAGLSLRIRALRAGMEFVLAQNFPVRLNTCDAPTAMLNRGKKYRIG